MRRAAFILFCSVLFLTGSRASAQLLTYVVASSVQLSTSTMLEQLAAIPAFSVAHDTAPITEAEVVDVEEGDESEADIFISSALAHPPDPVNLGGNGSLTLTRQDTGEKVTVHYRNKDGSYNQDELDKVSHLMHCSLDGEEIPVATKLVELLDAVEDHFGKKGLILLSGYRTPKFNSHVPGSAKHSMHMLGWAADIRIPGYSSLKVKRFGQKMGVGGVGYYPYKGFTHLDVGRSRYWVMGRPARRHHLRKKSPSPATRRMAARKTRQTTVKLASRRRLPRKRA